MDDELLVLQQAWPVRTIDGVPAVTEGTLTVSTQSGGGLLLGVSTGDELHPDGEYVQYPLSESQVQLLIRALQGEHLGTIRD